MREQMYAQLGSRCTSSELAAIGPWLKRLALQGAQITFESAVAAAQAIAPSVNPSSLLAAVSDAGFLVRRTMGQYEFSHALWRAFVVVDSFDPFTGWVEGPSDDEEDFARAQARLLPLAKTQEPQRTEILRGYAKTDLSAYMAAVSTLSIESYDRGVEQYVRSFVAGVEDIAQLLSSRTRALVEPWNGYPETEADGLLGAVYGNGTFEMRVRKPGEAQLIPVEDARKRTEFTPPAAVARGIGTSRLSGAKLCLDQLRSLWKSNVLPIIEPLAREQLFFWARALEMHATATTVADVITLANESTDKLLFEDDAWIDGEYLARWHRLNQRQVGFGISGPELLRLVSYAKVHDTTTIESLGHPGPDIVPDTAPKAEQDGEPYYPFRQYSVPRREERIRGMMNAALDAFHLLLEDDFSFLKPHSPLRHGPVTLHVILESDGERIETWWEPDVSGRKVIVACQPKQLIPSYAEIDRRVGGQSPGLRRMSYYNMGASLRTLDWSPVSMPATMVVCKFLLKCLGDALGERFTWFL